MVHDVDPFVVSGDSPYACTMCSSAFKTSTDLRRHFRIHTQEKPFSCPHCPFSTAVKCNLTTHIKRKHPPPPAHHHQTKWLHLNIFIPNVPFWKRRNEKPTRKRKQIHFRSNFAANFASTKRPPSVTIRIHFFLSSCNLGSWMQPLRLFLWFLESFKLHMVKQHKTKNYDSILDQFAKPAKKRMIREPSPTGRPFVSRFKCSEGDCTRSFVSEKSLRCHIRQHVTLHPPPAPTIEVIISASQSEGYEEATGATQGFLLLCDSVEESISVINPTETDPLL